MCHALHRLECAVVHNGEVFLSYLHTCAEFLRHRPETAVYFRLDVNTSAISNPSHYIKNQVDPFIQQQSHTASPVSGLLFYVMVCLTSQTCALQATVSGFRLVTRENVFKVCDQPHPLLVAQIVDAAAKAQLFKAYEGMKVG